jgi:hypothetical protein
MARVSDVPDDEFDPSHGTRSYLRWAQSMGASTLGEAFDLLEQFEYGNDVPEVLREDDTIDGVRDELDEGMELVGAGADLDDVL